MISGKSLELFFVDGKPDGMLTAEIFNWTGHVLRIPKIQLVDGLKRPQAQQTGVYLLLGEDDTGPLSYIGEAENMADRLKQHASQKAWWDQAVLITAAGDALHKAHVKYLESRLVELAKDAGQIRLENGNVPPRSSLSEAATANMESFLDTLQMVLPAIRVDALQNNRRAERFEHAPTNGALLLELSAPKRDIRAQATLVNGEVIVQAGSRINPTWIGAKKWNSNYQTMHKTILSSDVVRALGDHFVFQDNYAFTSLSAAAAIILGRSANGRLEWKLKTDGRSFAEWEDSRLGDVAEEVGL